MNEDYTKLKDFAQKRLNDSCRNDDDYDIRYWVGYIDGLNALQKRMDGDMAIEALEKQSAKKPKPHTVAVEKLKIGNANWCKGTTVYRCPNCNNFISRTYNFCYKCGQALDWSDDNA